MLTRRRTDLAGSRTRIIRQNSARRRIAASISAEEACDLGLGYLLVLPSKRHLNYDDAVDGGIDALT